MAGLGGESNRLMKYCRSRAQAPAIAGVAWLVPVDSVKNSWPTGKKLLAPIVPLPSTPQMPMSLRSTVRKQDRADPVPLGDGGGELWGAPPVTCVAGATRSGLIRPSAHGPRLENEAMSFASLASESGVEQPSSPTELLPRFAMDMDRTFSVPPTAMTFLAVPGGLTVDELGPPLLTANTITISWLPSTA